MRSVGVLSFEDVISQASQVIHDRSQTEIGYGVLKQLATDACREFARRTESVRGQETISFTSSFTTARLPIGVVRVMKGSMLFSTYTYRMLLDRCEERDVQAGITTTGMPTHWYVTDDLQSIGLYPAPSSSGTLYLDCIMSGREYVVTPITVTPSGSISTTGGVLGLPTRPDDWYNGCKVTVTSGTYLGLTNVIKDYVSSTGQCDFEFTMPATLPNPTTLEVVDCPDVPHHFTHYLVQYIVARALQTLRPNDAAGAMSVFEQGVAECVRLIHPRTGFRMKRVREFADVYEGG